MKTCYKLLLCHTQSYQIGILFNMVLIVSGHVGPHALDQPEELCPHNVLKQI